ncbi:MAG: ATP-dependent DNA ligase [Patescibacteria group bacterium]|nr:ATP-dependent DNA ligase [Patescibacteria group bacterium]
MKLFELAKTFESIEATRSRRQMSTLLADLFRRADPREVKIIPYLIQGRLGPPYSAPDMGIDERRLTEGIARVTNRSLEETWSLYKTLGDFGLVTERLLPERNKTLSIEQTYEKLVKMAQTSGPGSTEVKNKLLVELLTQLNRLEARYLVRIVQGKLRLGVGDATILDALAESVGNLDLRPKIERAYTFSSDLGLVTYILRTKGIEGVEKIGPTPGRPILPALAERLPSSEEAIKKLGRLIAEPKYDGLRLQLHKDRDKVWLFTRRLENITQALPSLQQGGETQVLAMQAILDGEVIGIDPKSGKFLPFQQTARRRRKYQVEKIELLYPTRYYIFDLLLLNGQDLTSKPFRERLLLLKKVIKEASNGPIFITPRLETENPGELEKFFVQMLEQGLEGVLVKRPDAPYHAGARLFNWVKLKRGYGAKLADTFDVVVVGYFKGRGKRAVLGIGSLLCAVCDPKNDRFRTVSRVGSGLTNEEWGQFRERLDLISVLQRPRQVDSLIEPDVWVDPRYVIEVIASEITRSPRHTCGKVGKEKGYSLRFPRFSRIRTDRRAEDATTEKEVIDQYLNAHRR